MWESLAKQITEMLCLLALHRRQEISHRLRWRSPPVHLAFCQLPANRPQWCWHDSRQDIPKSAVPQVPAASTAGSAMRVDGVGCHVRRWPPRVACVDRPSHRKYPAQDLLGTGFKNPRLPRPVSDHSQSIRDVLPVARLSPIEFRWRRVSWCSRSLIRLAADGQFTFPLGKFAARPISTSCFTTSSMPAPA